MTDDKRQPPALLLKWESLPGQTQIAIAFPVLVVLLFFVHITLLRQPAVRGALYAGVLGDSRHLHGGDRHPYGSRQAQGRAGR